LEPSDDVQDLAAYVDEGVPGAHRERGHDDPFDQGVRRREHERDVLARARLGLVGVHHEESVLLTLGWQERPLRRGREPGAAPSAQPGVFDGLDDRGRPHIDRRSK
jgi:hypothetical protein